MPKIVFLNREFGDQFCELPDGEYTVGRDPKNLLVVCEPSVSAKHCELLIFGREVIVRERGSRNGTFVNGMRVHTQSAVNHRQILRIGGVEVRVEIEAPSPEKLTSLSAVEDLRIYEQQSRVGPLGKMSVPFIFAPIETQRPE